MGSGQVRQSSSGKEGRFFVNLNLIVTIIAGFFGVILVVFLADLVLRWFDRGRWLEAPAIHKCHPPKLWTHKIGGLWQCNKCGTVWEIKLIDTGVSKRKGWVWYSE